MRKILALALALMLVVSIAPMAFAAVPDLPETITFGWSTGFSEPTLNSRSGDDRGYRPSGTVIAAFDTNISRDQWDRFNFGFVVRGAGASALRVDLQGTGTGTAWIRVRPVANLDRIAVLSYDVEIFLTRNRVPQAGLPIMSLEGKILNNRIEVNENNNFAIAGQGQYVRATDFIREFEIFIEQSVSITTTAFRNRNYYARANNDISDDDFELMLEYDGIYDVRNLFFAGAWTSNVNLGLTRDDWIYDADLNFLGRGNATDLPLLSKYYIADRELDVPDGAIDEPIEEPYDGDGDDSVNPPMGGDDVPMNVNANPGTGR
jgi:hypothetical protein